MEWLGWAALAAIVMAALSGGLALGLHLLAPAMSARKRTLTAAGIAGLLPGSVAFLGFLSEAQVADQEFFISLIALVVLQLIVLAVVTLPPAWFATTRLDKSERVDVDLLPRGGETQLLN